MMSYYQFKNYHQINQKYIEKIQGYLKTASFLNPKTKSILKKCIIEAQAKENHLHQLYSHLSNKPLTN
jgi:hypothetical protein